MHLEWIVSPLAIYGVIALSLVASLGLFLGIKREIQTVRGAADEVRETANSGMRKVEERIENLETSQPPMPPGGSLNLTKRAQALRMHHRGEAVASIAAALSMPTHEIELLIKLNTLLQKE